jgi:hypothetical protein
MPFTPTRIFVTAAWAALAAIGPGAGISRAQQPPAQGVVGSYFPTQLNPGPSNVLHVALTRNNPVQRLEITPAEGITVTGTTSRDLNQGSVWWEFTVDVARDAAPGPRTLVAVQQNGRTAPVTLTIPDHVPAISNVRIVSAKPAQEMIELQFAAANQGGTFDATPYVWFLLACGPGQPEAGVVRGTYAGGTVRANVPNPKTLKLRAGAPASGNRCELDVRATDASGVDSNTARVTFDFES